MQGTQGAARGLAEYYCASAGLARWTKEGSSMSGMSRFLLAQAGVVATALKGALALALCVPSPAPDIMHIEDGLVSEERPVGRPQHPQPVMRILRSSQDPCQQEGASAVDLCI